MVHNSLLFFHTEILRCQSFITLNYNSIKNRNIKYITHLKLGTILSKTPIECCVINIVEGSSTSKEINCFIKVQCMCLLNIPDSLRKFSGVIMVSCLFKSYFQIVPCIYNILSPLTSCLVGTS